MRNGDKNIQGKAENTILSPQISVIMSVYNTPIEYLRHSIESILNQTYRDFEFLIVDDASDNINVAEIIKTYQDHRIIFIQNKENKGLTENLNHMLYLARGKYIARMDADDIALPKRLEKQFTYMEGHPNIHVLGCFAKADSGMHKFGGNMSYQMRKVKMLFYNAGICHPSAMIRKCFLQEYNLSYDTTLKKAQDYDLWIRCLEWTNLMAYPEGLLYYREHEGQISRTNQTGADSQKMYARMIRKRLLEEMNICFSNAEEEVFFKIGEKDYNYNIDEFDMIFRILLEKNKTMKIYSQVSLKNELCLYRIQRMFRIRDLRARDIWIYHWALTPMFWWSILIRCMLLTRSYNKIRMLKPVKLKNKICI